MSQPVSPTLLRVCPFCKHSYSGRRCCLTAVHPYTMNSVFPKGVALPLGCHDRIAEKSPVFRPDRSASFLYLPQCPRSGPQRADGKGACVLKGGRPPDIQG